MNTVSSRACCTALYSDTHASVSTLQPFAKYQCCQHEGLRLNPSPLRRPDPGLFFRCRFGVHFSFVSYFLLLFRCGSGLIRLRVW